MTEVVDDLDGAPRRRAAQGAVAVAAVRRLPVRRRATSRTATRAAAPVLALATGRHLDAPVQQRLVEHVAAGGGLLLLGPAAGARPRGRAVHACSPTRSASRRGEVRARPPLLPVARRPRLGRPLPETRVGWLQELRPNAARSCSPTSTARSAGSTSPSAPAGPWCWRPSCPRPGLFARALAALGEPLPGSRRDAVGRLRDHDQLGLRRARPARHQHLGRPAIVTVALDGDRDRFGCHAPRAGAVRTHPGPRPRCRGAPPRLGRRDRRGRPGWHHLILLAPRGGRRGRATSTSRPGPQYLPDNTYEHQRAVRRRDG